MNSVLTMRGVTKRFKSQKALDDFSINVEKGDVYGFVGENGSGKTTVIRLIAGLIFADEGEISLFGANARSPEIAAARKKLGAIVETPSIYLNMSARDNLAMQCTLLGGGEDRIDGVLAEVGLDGPAAGKKTAANFSLGMRQRLGIAMALIGDPEFVILDEPMNGLDPAGIVEIRDLIIRLNREMGITFLISSHILTELSLVATKYGIISKGHMLREVTAEQLGRECARSIVVRAQDEDGLVSALSGVAEEGKTERVPGGVILYEAEINDVLAALCQSGVKIDGINCKEGSIEDFYLSTIGGAHRD